MDLLVEALVEDLPDGEGLKARHVGGGVCGSEKDVRTFFFKVGLGFSGGN